MAASQHRLDGLESEPEGYSPDTYRTPNKHLRNQSKVNDVDVEAHEAERLGGLLNHGSSPSRTRYQSSARLNASATLPAFRPLTITNPHVKCMGIPRQTHKHESESKGPIITPDIIKEHETLDKFRFRSGNGLIRGIRAQQGAINVDHGGGLSSNSSLSPMAGPGMIEGGRGHQCDIKGVGNLGSEKAKFRAQQMDWASTDLTCGEFNTTAQEVEGTGVAIYESDHTQTKILVEEEGLHDSDEIAGDVTILTPSQCTVEPILLENGHEEETDTELLTAHSNIRYEDFVEEFFTAPESVSLDIACPDHTTIPIAIPALPQTYGNPIESLQQGPPSPVLQNAHGKLPHYLVNLSGNISEEEYDDFDDEDLWREIAKRDIGIEPHITDVERQAKIRSTNRGDGTLMEARIVDQEPQAREQSRTSLHCLIKSARTRDKGGFRAPLPPTLLNPISHMSNTNATAEVSINTATKRMLIFPAGCPKLARMEGLLAMLNRINKYTSSQPTEPSISSMASETKWAHLPMEERQKPFTRSAPSDPVRERSPVEGLNTKNMIRVCFRVGEAIRFTNMANYTETKILTELFARVKFSERIGPKQNIQLGDVYHHHPPFLSGSFNLFRACSLWDEDSANLVGEHGKGKLVRVVGRVKRIGLGLADGMAGYWMDILSIWECEWEEVDRARGVVCGW